MKCPACGRDLLEKSVGDIIVDVCQGGCGGVWFDNHELRKFDEPHEAVGEELLNIEKDETIKLDHSKRRNCPKCNNIVMMRHFFSVKEEVEVDECPDCRGVWLDFGELAQIRKLFKTEKDRRKAALECFDEVFGEELSARHAKNEEKLKKSKKIANIFRFICPSYYIPGKQKWGAF